MQTLMTVEKIVVAGKYDAAEKAISKQIKFTATIPYSPEVERYLSQHLCEAMDAELELVQSSLRLGGDDE